MGPKDPTPGLGEILRVAFAHAIVGHSRCTIRRTVCAAHGRPVLVATLSAFNRSAIVA